MVERVVPDLAGRRLVPGELGAPGRVDADLEERRGRVRTAKERQDRAADPARAVVEGDRHLADGRAAAVERITLANEPSDRRLATESQARRLVLRERVRPLPWLRLRARWGRRGHGRDSRGGDLPGTMAREGDVRGSGSGGGGEHDQDDSPPGSAALPEHRSSSCVHRADHLRDPGRGFLRRPPPASQSGACLGRRRRSFRSPPRRSSASRRSGRCSPCCRLPGSTRRCRAKFITGPSSGAAGAFSVARWVVPVLAILLIAPLALSVPQQRLIKSAEARATALRVSRRVASLGVIALLTLANARGDHPARPAPDRGLAHGGEGAPPRRPPPVVHERARLRALVLAARRAAGRSSGGSRRDGSRTSCSRSRPSPRVPARAGSRPSSTTSTSRTRTRPPSAPPTRCRSPTGRSC